MCYKHVGLCTTIKRYPKFLRRACSDPCAMSTTEDSGAGPDRVEGGPGATDGQMRQKGDGADGESEEAEDAGLEHLTRDDLVERYRIMEEHLTRREAGLQPSEGESLRAQLADRGRAHTPRGAAAWRSDKSALRACRRRPPSTGTQRNSRRPIRRISACTGSQPRSIPTMGPSRCSATSSGTPGPLSKWWSRRTKPKLKGCRRANVRRIMPRMRGSAQKRSQWLPPNGCSCCSSNTGDHGDSDDLRSCYRNSHR